MAPGGTRVNLNPEVMEHLEFNMKLNADTDFKVETDLQEVQEEFLTLMNLKAATGVSMLKRGTLLWRDCC